MDQTDIGHFERVEPAKAELARKVSPSHDRAVALYRECYQEEARHALLSA
jgi:hypothetical protein